VILTSPNAINSRPIAASPTTRLDDEVQRARDVIEGVPGTGG
jgi:hypothetical protein